MSAPWLAKLIKENKSTLTLNELQNEIRSYLTLLYHKNLEYHFLPEQALRRVKAVCPTIFQSFPNGNEIRSKILRSENFETVKEAVEELVLESAGE